MNAVARYLTAPQRGLQLGIWALLLALLATIVPMSGLLDPIPVSAVAGSAATDAWQGPTPMASDTLAAAQTLADKSAQSHYHYLPALRWQAHTEFPEDLGMGDVPKAALSSLAEVGYSLAGFIWWALLLLMKTALTLDLVNTFAGAINSFFTSTQAGLNNSGLFWAVGAFLFLAAAVAWVTGRNRNQKLRQVVTGILVLALLQTLGANAALDSKSDVQEPTAGYEAPVGTPAWLAVTGNKYINDLAYTTHTVFGATNGLTKSVTGGGSALVGEDTIGKATCAAYIDELYARYHAGAANQKTGSSSAAALAAVSFMWQRSMYDPFAQAAFGNSADGGRITCHWLERHAKITPESQQDIAKAAGYKGVGVGPFMIAGHKKQDHTAMLAWAVCKDDTGMRQGWRDIEHFQERESKAEKGNTNICQEWWTSDKPSGLTTAVGDVSASFRANPALAWTSVDNMQADTIGTNYQEWSPTDWTKASPERMQEVHDVILASWGHNGGQRMLAGWTASATSMLFAYAFGAPAVGVALSQLVLVFLLLVLPWTLLMLALPGRSGGQNQTGVRMLRLTGMAFGAKLVFLVVLGLTLTIMSLLYGLVMNDDFSVQMPDASGSTALAATGWSPFVGATNGMTSQFWTIVVPVVSIVAMRYILKGLGLGNLMGFKGIGGFATAALRQGGASGFMERAKQPGKLRGTLTKTGKTLTKSYASRFGGRMAERALSGSQARYASALLAQRKTGLDENGNPIAKPALDDDLAQKLAAGALSPEAAGRRQRLRDQGVSDEHSELVAKGEMSKANALALAKAHEHHQLLRAEKLKPGLGKRLDEDPSGVGEEPRNPLRDPGALRDRAAILEERDAALAPLALVAGKMDEQTFHKENVENLTGRFNTLVSNVSVDGTVDVLDDQQVAAAIKHAKEQVHPDLRDLVTAGRHGGPALMVPSLDTEGRLSLTADQLSDPQVCLEVISNPLNHLPRDITLRRKGEDADAWHARMNLTLMEAGLMDVKGNVANMAAEVGVNVEVDGWEDKVKQVAQEWAKSAAARQTVTLNVESRDRINGVAYQLSRVSPAATKVDVTGGRFEVAQSEVEQGRAAVEAAMAKIAAQTNRLSISIHDPKEAGKAKTELLVAVERDALAAAEAAMVGQLQAARLHDGTTEEAISELRDELKKELARISSDIQKRVVRARLASSSNEDELRDLGTYVRRELERRSASMEQEWQRTAREVAERNTQQAEMLKDALKNRPIPAPAPPLPKARHGATTDSGIHIALR